MREDPPLTPRIEKEKEDYTFILLVGYLIMKLSSTFVALCSLAPLFGAHGQEAPPTRRERQRARREAEEANAAEAAEVDIPLSPLAPERGSIIPGEYIVQIDNEAIGADGLTVEAVAGQFGISEEKIFTRK